MRLRFFTSFVAFFAIQQACGGSDSNVGIADDSEAGASSDAATARDSTSSADSTASKEAGAGDASTIDAIAIDAMADGAAPDGTAVDASIDGTVGDAASDVSVNDADTVDVKDAGADVACPLPKVQTAKGCVMPLILYRGGSSSSALGGRSGANSMCASAQANLPLQTNDSVAFISVDANDEIRDLPGLKGFATDVPIVGPTGKVIADNWDDLLDGTIDRSLFSADVLSVTQLFWYSGSDKGGAATSKTCTGWTNGSAQSDATSGTNSATDDGWIQQNGNATCGLVGYSLLCIGY